MSVMCVDENCDLSVVFITVMTLSPSDTGGITADQSVHNPLLEASCDKALLYASLMNCN